MVSRNHTSEEGQNTVPVQSFILGQDLGTVNALTNLDATA